MDYQNLEKYGITSIRKGFFVEAGANDGITNSLSFQLERRGGWSGILIDPVKENIEMCKKYRSKRNIYIHGALVAEDYKYDKIKGNFGLPPGENSAKSKVESLVEKWPPKNGSISSVEVNAIKFKEIYRDEIDLFILDVEGYEYEVLKGIDFTKPPLYFIIEIRKEYNLMDISKFLYQKGYSCVADLDDSKINMSICNLLFKKMSDIPIEMDQNVFKHSWDFLLDNSTIVLTGDSNELKNNISESDVKAYFNFKGDIFKTSRGDFIIDKLTVKENKITIKDWVINIEITKKF
jgi:FkbM family methyltransferase